LHKQLENSFWEQIKKIAKGESAGNAKKIAKTIVGNWPNKDAQKLKIKAIFLPIQQSFFLVQFIEFCVAKPDIIESEISYTVLRSIFDNISDSIIVFDKNFKIAYANNHFRLSLKKVFHSSLRIHQSIYDVLNLLCANDAALYQDFTQKSIVSERDQVVFELEFPGLKIYYQINCFPIFQANKEVLYYLLFVQEITARKKAEKELYQKNQLLNNIVSLQHNFLLKRNFKSVFEAMLTLIINFTQIGGITTNKYFDNLLYSHLLSKKVNKPASRPKNCTGKPKWALNIIKLPIIAMDKKTTRITEVIFINNICLFSPSLILSVIPAFSSECQNLFIFLCKNICGLRLCAGFPAASIKQI
jgi:PAS domain-containing protein